MTRGHDVVELVGRPSEQSVSGYLAAVDHGILLVGGAWFAQQRARLAVLKREGWQRTPRGWYRETGSNGSAAYCG